MIAKTVYISDDGKMFTNKMQCQEYELNTFKKNDIAMLWYNNVTMYNGKGEKISTTYNPETEPQNFLKFIRIRLDSTVMFLRINPKCDNLDWSSICQYFIPRTHTGVPRFCTDELWRYDSDAELWHSYKDDIKQLKDNWGSFCAID